MHIPDGYLGPVTCAAGFTVMLPLWAVASRKLSTTVTTRQVPLLAMSSAFSFVIMMFNIPIPGGTTGHAVGAVLISLLIGPWAACISVSIALILQAVLFGDGGITAIGVNCFNLAVVMPFAGSFIYRLIAAYITANPLRIVMAAGTAGYAGLVTASVCAGLEFGLQPFLHHTSSGQALYCPYGFASSVTIMAGEHFLIFGWIEAAVTSIVAGFLLKKDPALILGGLHSRQAKSIKYWFFILILVCCSPLGLYLPAKFGAGTAWGEWSAEELGKITGYIPSGLAQLNSFWKSLIPGYVSAFNDQGVSYFVSALLGTGACIGAIYLLARLLLKRKDGKFPRKAVGFPERTTLGVLTFLQETFTNTRIASVKGFLQERDPRIKLVCVVLLLLSVLVSKNIPFILAVYILILNAAFISRIPVGFFFRRTLLFIPLFSLCIVFPALFSFITPGEPLISLGNLHITKQGVFSVMLFITRVTASVSTAILLVLTTRHMVLLRAMRFFRIPRLFVMTLTMSYRYVLLFLDIIKNSFTAVKSRAGFVTSVKTGQNIAGSNIAALWLRSYYMHEQIHYAMLSRGFTGEPVAIDSFRARIGDFATLTVCALILIGSVWLNRYFY